MKQKPARTLPVLTAAFALALMLGVSQQASAQSPTLLRISNQLPASAAVTKGLELWKTRVEAATGGRFKVEIYNNSQLYKDNEVFPAVQGGQIDMGLVISAQFTAYDPVFGIFDLPGLFKTYDQATTSAPRQDRRLAGRASSQARRASFVLAAAGLFRDRDLEEGAQHACRFQAPEIARP